MFISLVSNNLNQVQTKSKSHSENHKTKISLFLASSYNGSKFNFISFNMA